MKLWGLLLLAATALAQTQPAPKQPASRVIGEVTAKDPGSNKLTVKADNGTAYTVQLSDKTTYLRVPPGERDLTKAAKIGLSDVDVGDRVLARGPVSEDEKNATATSIIVMTKGDLAKKHEQDRLQWQQRGLAGLVTAVNPDAHQVTLTVREGDASKTVKVTAPDGTTFHRYSPDSVKFSDAKPSSLAEMQVGDQVRVLGDKNADGTEVKAEAVVFGSFRTVAGTVITADSVTGEIKIKDLETKQPLTVRTNRDSVLKRMPPQMAAMLVRQRDALEAGRSGGAPGGATGSGRSGGQPLRVGGQGAPGGPGAGARPTVDLQRMLDRMPALTVTELKAGDALMISSTKGMDRSVVTAITLLAGVEPLLTAPSKSAGDVNLGSWSLGGIGSGID